MNANIYRTIIESVSSATDDMKNVNPRTATGSEPKVESDDKEKDVIKRKYKKSAKNTSKCATEESLSAKLKRLKSESANPTKKTKAVRNRKSNESYSSKKTFRKKSLNESLTDKVTEDDITASICPVCGSKEFDPVTGVCPICGEPTDKYLTADADTENMPEDYTTISIDGEEKVLIDSDGNTAVIEPDIINDVLDDDTHKLVIDPTDPEEGTIMIDSGVASFIGDEPAIESCMKKTESDEPEEATDKVAYLKIDEPVGEVADLLTEGNEDNVNVNDDEDGVVLTATLSGIEEVTESDDGQEVVNDNDSAVVNINLEEIPSGTLIHVDEVDNVDDLVDIVNELLPEDAQIETNDGIDDQEDENSTVTESARVVKLGFVNITRNGKCESYRCRTVINKSNRKLESELPETNTQFTNIANKNRKVADKGDIKSASSETDMKKMSVLERRKSVKESEKLRSILCSLGCDSAKLESDESIEKIDELIKCCGNIKEYKSGVKRDKDGLVTTMESKRPNRKVTYRRSSK